MNPQPEMKRVSQYHLYHCDWKIGDVYAYRLLGDYAKEKDFFGKYLFFVKIDETIWYPGHTVPVVYFFWIVSDSLLKISELEKIEYMPQFFTPKAYEKDNQSKKYMLTLLNTSSRVIPKKNLLYIGNIENIQHIDKEDTNSYEIEWKNFEKYIIKNIINWKGYKDF